MSDNLTAEADRRLEEAIVASGGRDPREFYRERLRELKASNAAGYQSAVAYYRDQLIPSVASGTLAPFEAWAAYGRILAESVAPGRAISVDSSGRAQPFEEPAAPEMLVLHLPDGGGRALLVSLPAELSPAQRATYDVLVSGKQRPSA
ncbi:MAG: hypothetical protein O2992_09730 [Gemmatimonadetes bacterium]|nr:hypothetical protein [Gemmatimonadota bacterium]